MVTKKTKAELLAEIEQLKCELGSAKKQSIEARFNEWHLTLMERGISMDVYPNSDRIAFRKNGCCVSLDTEDVLRFGLDTIARMFAPVPDKPAIEKAQVWSIDIPLGDCAEGWEREVKGDGKGTVTMQYTAKK